MTSRFLGWGAYLETSYLTCFFDSTFFSNFFSIASATLGVAVLFLIGRPISTIGEIAFGAAFFAGAIFVVFARVLAGDFEISFN